MAITGHRRDKDVEVIGFEDGFNLTAAMLNVADFPEDVEGAVAGLVLRPGTLLYNLAKISCENTIATNAYV